MTAARDRDWHGELRDAWARSDLVFDRLLPHALLERPIALRHPFVFYLGHLPAFAWNQVARGVLRRAPFHPEFDRLFERGIDPASEREAASSSRGAWPSRGEIEAYRDGVREAIAGLVDEVLDRGGDDVLARRGRVLSIVLEHERMHHETLLYMLQEAPPSAKRPPPGVAPAVGRRGAEPRTVRVPAGTARLGADFERIEFGWDNEFPETRVAVDAFEVDALPVTHGDLLDFVEARGYERDDLWSEEGAAWRRATGLRRPHAWSGGASPSVRTAFWDVPFEDARDWPAQVSWAEADAYARWRGRRLPTEAELHRAAYADGAATGGDEPRARPWGDGAVTAERANASFAQWTPEPVGRRPSGASAFGVEEVVGNGWEWTSTTFAPYPGFRAWARTYPGYSADFFDGRHYVLHGASWATDRSLVRRSFRNWFQPHYPYVFSKFRTARSIA